MKCAIVCVVVCLLVAYTQAQLGYTVPGYGGYAGYGGLGFAGNLGLVPGAVGGVQGYAVSSYAPGYTTGYAGYVPSYGVQYRTAAAIPAGGWAATAAAPTMVGAYPAPALAVGTGVPAFATGFNPGFNGLAGVPVGGTVPAMMTRLYGAGGAGAAGAGAVSSKK